ncbi:MAG: hypothetical protein JXR70_18560 [Spirochaetales bacterium]|nr:hypothetical protein [Spirochaetales bacterium]
MSADFLASKAAYVAGKLNGSDKCYRHNHRGFGALTLEPIMAILSSVEKKHSIVPVNVLGCHLAE